MTWGIYKKHRELRGGGIFSTLLNAISAPIKLIGKGIGNAIKPGAGDDFVKGYDSVISKFGGGAPRLRRVGLLPRRASDRRRHREHPLGRPRQPV